MATMLTVAVVLLAVLVGGLSYGSFRLGHATASATKKIDGLNNQIKSINQNLQQVQAISQGIQEVNNNLQQLNKGLSSSTTSWGTSSYHIP